MTRLRHLLSLTVAASLAANALARAEPLPVAPNRAPLAPTPMLRLPPGAVRADGWLLEQLTLARDGLTGHAEEVIPELGPSSRWLGGNKGDDWEKGPYYVKGLVELAYTLDDDGLKRKAQKWVDWSINSQRPDGQFGPASNDDWWPRMVMTYALRDYADATGDPRVVPMLAKFLRYAADTLPKKPLREWGKARAGDLIDTAFWVYNHTGDPAALAAADRLHAQAYDWTDILTRNRFLSFGNDFMPKHAVNVAQAMKMPPVWSQRSKADADRRAFGLGMDHLLKMASVPLAVTTGTEFLAGRSAAQGSETCTVVEQMLSDETAVAILGDEAIADQLERTAYNAMPGAMTKDLKRYQYYTPTNEVVAIDGPNGFNQDYGDGFMPGPVSGFPCCCYNLHMGWPMLVRHAWMRTDAGGLAAAVYGPTVVRATLPKAGAVTVAERTNYPFEPDVHLKVSVARPARFPLRLRVPAWCDGATVSVNGKPEPQPAAGAWFTIDRQWSDGDAVELNLPMRVSTVPGVNGAVSVARGPLVFSLKMSQQQKVAKPGKDGFTQLSFTSPDPWNLALAVDPADPAKGVEVHTGPMPAGNPFDPERSPVWLTLAGRRVPSWGLAWTGRTAEDPPVSPVASDEPEQQVTLVPFGAQSLRVTAFPYLGTPAAPAASYACDFADTDAPGWVAYGGGWHVEGNALRPASNAGSGSFGLAGVKNVATATDFDDLTYDADVTPAPTGDTGLLFRVSHPTIGPDAYDGYYVGLDPSARKVQLGRGSADNHWTPIAQADADVPAGKATHVRVVAVGSNIRVFLNNDEFPVLTATDETFKRGAVGVRQYATSAEGPRGAAFANVRVVRGEARK